MTSFLVFLHVAAAILLIGPVCVSTSSYQTQMAKAAQGDQAALGSARVLHNITNTYGYISWCLLFFVILPKQKKSLTALESNSTFDYAAAKKPLSAFGGVFNLLWIVCLILMYVNF